ncbi:hypothetical protein N9991_00305, partial [bacterium]|nr:hypothetical protein [bacterium]
MVFSLINVKVFGVGIKPNKKLRGSLPRFFIFYVINKYGCLRGPHNTNSLLKELRIMGNLTRYTAADLPVLLDKISKNSIGM